MATAWIRRGALLAVCLTLSCSKGGNQRAIPNDIPAALTAAGAELSRDESRPSKPITAVYFKNQTVSDDALALVKRLPNATTLGLSGCQVTNAGLKEVASTPNLQKLYMVDCTWLTDADLKELTPLRNLRELVLTGCSKITDAGLKELASLSNLRLLELSECKEISDVGLKELAALKNLRRLGLSGCVKITDAGEKEVVASVPKVVITRETYDFTRTGVR
jgi:hypothetical protein